MVDTTTQRPEKKVDTQNIDAELSKTMDNNKGPNLYVCCVGVIINFDRDGVNIEFARVHVVNPKMQGPDGTLQLYNDSNSDDPKGLGALNVYFPVDPTTESGLPDYVPDPSEEGTFKPIFMFLQKRPIAGLYDAKHYDAIWRTTSLNALDCYRFGKNLGFFQSFVEFLTHLCVTLNKNFNKDILPSFEDHKAWADVIQGFHPDLASNESMMKVYRLHSDLTTLKWKDAIKSLKPHLPSNFPEGHIETQFCNWLQFNYQEPITVPSTSKKIDNREVAKDAATQLRNLRDLGHTRLTLDKQVNSKDFDGNPDPTKRLISLTGSNAPQVKVAPRPIKTPIETIPVGQTDEQPTSPSNLPPIGVEEDDDFAMGR